MGNCLSKPDEKKLTSTTQRLGTNNPAPSRQTAQSQVNKQTSEGHRLGSTGSETHLDTKSAAAKAAEERFNKQQEKLKDSQSKLKAMEKMSRLEKGL